MDRKQFKNDLEKIVKQNILKDFDYFSSYKTRNLSKTSNCYSGSKAKRKKTHLSPPMFPKQHRETTRAGL